MDFLLKHQRRISTVLLLVTIFMVGYVVGDMDITMTQAQESDIVLIGDVDDAFAPIYETYEVIQSRYVDADSVDVPTLVNGAISGMIDALDDPFSSYLDPSSFSSFTSDLSGEVEGIGVVIFTNDDEEIEVRQVLEGTGAEVAGVRPGDVFIEVDGRNVTGLNQTELAMLVRGEAGTQVTITFRRGDELVTLNITRVRFDVPNVETDVLDNNIAYVSLSEFNERSASLLRQAFEDVDVNSRAGLIFDLRDNPGGLLSSAVNISSLFIEDGVILYESFGDGREETFEATGDFAGINVPIVVLVNENSASASELVSGAMQDREVATLIGEVTFGKGTVQTLQPLSNEGAVRLTIARYLLPSRRWIHDVGVTPDIEVPFDELEAMGNDDPQLDAAVNYLLDTANAGSE